MIELCLFDLDDTLIHTKDLEDLRIKGLHPDNEQNYRKILLDKILSNRNRIIYSEDDLLNLKKQFKGTKFGIFTRSPCLYADTLLYWAYPNLAWDVTIAREDVVNTKPSGEGIIRAATKLKISDYNNIVLIGDSLSDIQAAYDAGCIAILDRHAWQAPTKTNWKSIDHIPDAIIDQESKIELVLSKCESYLPELERLYAKSEKLLRVKRFVKIGHFDELPAQRGRRPFEIHVAGRYFSKHDNVSSKRDSHALTKAIDKSKNSVVFPLFWIEAIKSFIVQNFVSITKRSLEICVIPHRYTAEPRLEKLLAQLKLAFDEKSYPTLKIGFHPELLAYKEGSRSHHKEHLDKDDRFANVRDHLFVNEKLIFSENSPSILVIDDVVTTGASLIYAEKYLKIAGASSVTLFALAKNIGKNYDTDLT